MHAFQAMGHSGFGQQRSIAATRYHVAEREFDVLVTNLEGRKDFIDTKNNYIHLRTMYVSYNDYMCSNTWLILAGTYMHIYPYIDDIK